MKKKSSFRCFIFCIVLFVAMMPLAACSSTVHFQYEEYADGIVITSMIGQGQKLMDLNIPEEYEGKKVVAIGKAAFKNDLFLKRVSIPKTVQTVGDDAFLGCENLLSVDVRGSKTIGSAAFGNCKKLTQVTLPDNLETIAASCFIDCQSLSRMQLPASVREIMNYAFKNCIKLTALQCTSDSPPKLPTEPLSIFEGCDKQIFVIEVSDLLLDRYMNAWQVLINGGYQIFPIEK